MSVREESTKACTTERRLRLFAVIVVIDRLVRVAKMSLVYVGHRVLENELIVLKTVSRAKSVCSSLLTETAKSVAGTLTRIPIQE